MLRLHTKHCRPVRSQVARLAQLPSVNRRVHKLASTANEDAVKELDRYSAGLRSSLAVSVETKEAPKPAPSEPMPQTETPAALFELNKDNFDSFLAEAGEKLVIVDFYTDWCGPCKMIYPELVKLSSELAPAAQIVKLNCNKFNKDLGVKLQIKVAPTFHLYRNSTKVAEMTGAKVDKLKGLIQEHLKA